MKRCVWLVALLLATGAGAWGEVIQEQTVEISDPMAGWWLLYFFDGREVTIERPQIVPDKKAITAPTIPNSGTDVWSHIVDRQEGVFAWMTPPQPRQQVQGCPCDVFPGLYAGRHCPKCGRYCPPAP